MNEVQRLMIVAVRLLHLLDHLFRKMLLFEHVNKTTMALFHQHFEYIADTVDEFMMMKDKINLVDEQIKVVFIPKLKMYCKEFKIIHFDNDVLFLNINVTMIAIKKFAHEVSKDIDRYEKTAIATHIITKMLLNAVSNLVLSERVTLGMNISSNIMHCISDEIRQLLSGI